MTNLRILPIALLLVGCSRDTPPVTPPDSVTAAPAAAPMNPEPPAIAASEASSASAAPDTNAASAAGEAPSASEASLPKKPERTPDIEYVPTPQNVVDKMLEVVKLKKEDVLYDLGCGDGRIVVTAAKRYGVKAIGFDIDPERVKESRDNVKKGGVERLVTIELKDIFKIDLSPATVVTLYLLPELNVKLIPQLEKLNDGARIVSHDFDMEGVKPEKKWSVLAPDHMPPHKDRAHHVYLWRTPLKKESKEKSSRSK